MTESEPDQQQHLQYLQRAVELATHGMSSGDGGPFGALVVRGGQVLAEGWNRVLGSNDPTAHAEITVIRAACSAVGSFQLTDAVVYSSCEPCPMCLGALYWARPAAVYFAAGRADAAAGGFDDSMIYDEVGLPPDARSLPFRQLQVPGAAEVFAGWVADDSHTRY